MAPIFLGLIYLGGIPFAILIAVAAGISIYEWVRMARRGKHFLLDMLIGVIYLLIANLSFVVLRLHFPEGLYLVIALILAVWASDIGAYFTGKTFKGPKMSPVTSPNKTWSGLIGGMLCSGVVLSVFEICANIFSAHVIVVFLTGFAFGGVGQIGDLFISAMKRRVGVKDTGTLIPGHGGLLDRIDSLLLVSPAFVASCLLWLL